MDMARDLRKSPGLPRVVRGLFLSRAPILLFLALIPGLLFTSCDSPETEVRTRNLLLISIDTLRADRLGSYGSPIPLTPNLDQLAKDGIRFDQVWTTAPITLPSHASLLTGLRPSRHGVLDNSPYPLSKEAPTLATILAEEGYACSAVVGAAPLDQRFGLDRGFQTYDGQFDSRPGDPRFSERTGEDVVSRARRILKQVDSERPFFLFVHFFDPHAPYSPPSLFASGPGSDYDREVTFVDHCVGNLLSILTSEGLAEETLIVFTADHGEGLSQHGEQTHAHLVHEATLRIPLIFRLPQNAQAGREIFEPISIVDVAPTVLSLLGKSQDRFTLGHDGFDLSSILLDPKTRPPMDRPLYAESHYGNLRYNWAITSAIRIGNFKWIDHGGRTEGFNLELDPEEKNPLLPRPDQKKMFSELLMAERERTALASSRLQHQPHLVNLGYVEPSPAPSSPTMEENRLLPAPQDKLPVVSLLNKAMDRRKKNPRQALEAATEACRLDPLNPEAHFILGYCLRDQANRHGRQGTPDPVILHQASLSLRRALELRPFHRKAVNMLASVSVSLTDTTEVAIIISEIEEAVARGAGDRTTRFMLAGSILTHNPENLSETELGKHVTRLLKGVMSTGPSPPDDLSNRAQELLLTVTQAP